jgi:ABC-2 type transport system ATP-binding protein
MPAIEVEKLHKRYREKTAVQDVSFSVEAGEIFGILGPNGAGKTTTVECLAGLRRADGGTLRVDGLDPARERDALRRVLGVQLQECELPTRLKVREALELYASFYPEPAEPAALLRDWGLADKADTPYGKLSGGQKQRVSITLALVGNPRIVILDELTTGLDPQARRDTWQHIEQIRERGVTVLLVTHFMDEAERLCDRLALIDAGRVVALDTPTGLIARTSSTQTIRFRVSEPFDIDLLGALPEVESAINTDGRCTVTGTGNLLHAVTSLLARQQIVAAELRVEQAGLDDAFLALTGSKLS